MSKDSSKTNTKIDKLDILEKLEADLKEDLKSGTRERVDALKDAVRAAYRRGDMDYQGRLYVDPKYKKPGKTLRIDDDTPQARLHLERLGYTIVRDSDIQVGSGSLSEPSNMGSAIHIEQSIYGAKQPGILYEIESDLLAAREEIQAEDNDGLLKGKINDNTNHQI